MTIDAFFTGSGSLSSVSGGAAASAVAGALVAGQVTMVAELSVGPPKSEPYAATIETARVERHRLGVLMVSLADAAAFARHMAAVALPRTTDAELAARKAALALVAAEAIEPPRAMVATCLEIATACERLAGRSNLLKPGAVVVDVGINVVGESIVGDVDESAYAVASAITPVPGGVGPLTNAILLTHLMHAARDQAEGRRALGSGTATYTATEAD